MQNRLSEKERERIAEAYSKHPLYITCHYAFKRSEAQMKVLGFTPEEVFAESADVIDNIIVERDDLEEYLSLLWDDLLTKIRRWESKAQDAELSMAVSAILYIAAEAVSAVRMQDYDELAVVLLRLIKANAGVSAIEHSRVLNDIAHYQEDVEEWMLNYLDEDTFLTDAIEETIHPKRKGNKTGKTIHDPETITDTFVLNINEDQEIINLRLSLIFRTLKNKGFISANSDQKLVYKLFQGEPIETKIEWTGAIGELKYFFDELLDHHYINKVGSAGQWQMVCAHFKLKKVKKNGQVSYKNLTPEQLKDGKSKQTKDLDDIISFFNPNLINANRLREIWANSPEEEGVSKRDIFDSGMRFK